MAFERARLVALALCAVGCESAALTSPADSGKVVDAFVDSATDVGMGTDAIGDSATSDVADALKPIESGPPDADFDATPLPPIAECPFVTPTVGKLVDGSWILVGTTDGAAIAVDGSTLNDVYAISLTTGDVSLIAASYDAVRVDARAALALTKKKLVSYRSCDGTHVLGESTQVYPDSSRPRLPAITSPSGTSALFVDTAESALTLAAIDGSAIKHVAPADLGDISKKCFDVRGLGDRWIVQHRCYPGLISSVDAKTGVAFELVPGAQRLVDASVAGVLVNTDSAAYVVPPAGGLAVPFVTPRLINAVTTSGGTTFYSTTDKGFPLYRRTGGTTTPFGMPTESLGLTPDEKWLLFLSPRDDPSGVKDLWVLPVDGDKATNLTTYTAGSVVLGNVALTADGLRLVWFDADPEPEINLYARTLPDGANRSIASAAQFAVAGNTVLYSVRIAGSHYKLMALDLTSPTSTPVLVAADIYGDFFVHPARKHVIYTTTTTLEVATIP